MYTFKWIVSQIGARQHYGVPRGFVYQDRLHSLYTDVWCRWGSSLLKNGPRSLRAFAGRHHSDMPSDCVFSYTIRSALARARTAGIRTTEGVYGEYLRFGESFGRWVTRDLEKKRIDPARVAFFGFNTGCLETLEMLRKRDVFTIVDQIDPARTEEELVLREVEKWPGWQDTPGRIPNAYYDRLSAEWGGGHGRRRELGMVQGCSYRPGGSRREVADRARRLRG